MRVAQADFQDNLRSAEATLTQIINDMQGAFARQGWRVTLEPADRRIADTEITWRLQGSITDIDRANPPMTLGFSLILRRADSTSWDLVSVGMKDAYANQLPRGWKYDKSLVMDQAGTARDLVNLILQSWESDIRQTGN